MTLAFPVSLEQIRQCQKEYGCPYDPYMKDIDIHLTLSISAQLKMLFKVIIIKLYPHKAASFLGCIYHFDVSYLITKSKQSQLYKDMDLQLKVHAGYYSHISEQSVFSQRVKKTFLWAGKGAESWSSQSGSLSFSHITPLNLLSRRHGQGPCCNHWCVSRSMSGKRMHNEATTIWNWVCLRAFGVTRALTYSEWHRCYLCGQKAGSQLGFANGT